MNNKKAQDAMRIFKEIAKHAESATDLHNAFFGIGGKFGQMFPTGSEREAFAQTPEYAEMVRIRAELRQKETARAST